MSLPEPYYSHGGITIYHGDCRDILPHVTADVVVTDPPYGINYNSDSRRFSRKSSPYWDCVDNSLVSSLGPVRGDDGPFDPAPWVGWPCVLWGANHYADKLTPSGGWLVWDKRRGAEGMAESGWPLSEAELAWTNVRGSVRVFRYLWSGLLRDGDKGEYYHPTQKPVALMRWCLSFVPDGVVLDPFMGSGTTLVAAKQLGRKAIGIEIEERYCEIAVKRLAQEVLPLAPQEPEPQQATFLG